MRYPVDVYTGKIQAYPEGKPSAIAKIQVDGELMLTDLMGKFLVEREQMRYPVDVYTGKIQAYPEGKPSAIAKIQVDGELMLTDLGLEGDEQAEKKIHGGPDRALCHYPREHYLYWAREFPEQAELFVAPAFGENLSTDGLTESNVYIGDIFRWGEALIQVSQPRSPCYKLNYHFDISDIAQLMQNTGKVGWLYSVIAPGLVSADAPLELVSRVSDVIFSAGERH